MNAILLFQASQLGDQIHPFVVSEVDAFCRRYEQVYLICFQFTCPPDVLTCHKNLKVITVSLNKARKNFGAMGHLLTSYGLKDMSVALRAGIFNKGYLAETAKVLLFGGTLAKETLKIIASQPDEKWVVEGYWLTGPAFAAALAKRKFPNIVAVARCHSSEADPVRNPHCVCQMKDFLYRTLDRICFVSEWGKENFEKHIMPRYGYSNCEKATVSRLGTVRRSQHRNNGSQDGVIRILTCSRAVKLKRLELIAGALQHWDGDMPIHWTHIGDGPCMEQIGRMTESFDAKVSCHMPGALPNEKVHEYMASQPVDLFVNVSEFEGLPVSIMEAQSYGIACLATDAGGTRELVDDSVGCLLPVNCSEEQVRAALKNLAERLSSEDGKKAMQDASFCRWSSLCDKEKNYRTFFEDLQALTDNME